MNINARIGLAFGVGACIGAGGGFLVARRLLAVQAERRISSEVELVKEHYNTYVEHLNEAHAAALANATAKGNNPVDGAAAVGVADPRAGDVKTDYQRVSRNTMEDYLPGPDVEDGDVPAWAAGYTPRDQVGPDGTGRKDPLEGLEGEDPDVVVTEDDQDGGELPAGVVLDQTKPYVISDDEFEDDEGLNHTKIEMTWYSGDGALIDEGEQPIRNPAEILGPGFAAQFGNKSGDSRIVYIRNRTLSVDFLVKLHDGKYVDEILNYGKPK